MSHELRGFHKLKEGTTMRRILLGITTALLLTVMGCEEKGPAEEAGEKIDETLKDAEREVEDAFD